MGVFGVNSNVLRSSFSLDSQLNSRRICGGTFYPFPSLCSEGLRIRPQGVLVTIMIVMRMTSACPIRIGTPSLGRVREQSNSLSERRAVNIFMASLQGSLIDALYDLPKDSSWENMILAVRKRWSLRGTQGHLSTWFLNEFRKPHMDSMDYTVRLQQLSRMAHGTHPAEHHERLLQEQLDKVRPGRCNLL